MKVDFIIIGSMKSGTSSLREILKRHPDIEFSKKGEPHFFSKNKDWKSNIVEYHNLFQENNNKVYGEGSTTYTQYPHFNLELWNDIYEYNKDIKLIYMVRNPIDRIISHYIHLFQRGKINCTIEEAIREYPEIINTSKYYTQIKPFIELFGKQKILILDFDEFVCNKEKVVGEVAKFLNVSDTKFEDIRNEHSNKSIGEYKIDHKFDSIIKRVSPFKRIFPKGIRKRLLFLFAIRKKRLFTEKPSLSQKYINIISAMVNNDIIELSKFSGKDFTKWL